MQNIFKKRREKLIKSLKDGVLILKNASVRKRNKDVYYPYRFNSDFFYLTGFTEPHSVLLVEKRADRFKTIFFCKEKNPTEEVWNGTIVGTERIKSQMLYDEVYSIDKFNELSLKLTKNHNTLYYEFGDDPNFDSTITYLINESKKSSRSGDLNISNIINPSNIIANMRLIKDEFEIIIMKKAAIISAQAHINAMKKTPTLNYEYEVQAELEYIFKKNGANEVAYPSIVAGGKNACILHYTENLSKLNKNDLILIDAGCEFKGYASDITRTFPVSGKFSSSQKDLYEIVLASQKKAIENVKLNNSFDKPNQEAIKILSQGFIDLGLCKGSVDEVIEKKKYRRFYFHNTGHWLGLDVHDVGNYMIDNNWTKFKKNMICTVEPGCYINKAEDIHKDFWNIGIRIEDDVLVTANDNEILTKDVPKEIEEIEKIMIS